MTVDNPPSMVVQLTGQVSEKNENVNSVSIIETEQPTTNDTVPVELNSPYQEKRAVTKRRGMFNNPFSKNSPKKETSEDAVHMNDTVNREVTHGEKKLTTSANGENKIVKGLGSLYTRIKKSASSHNIEEICESSGPPPTPLIATSTQTTEICTDTPTAAAIQTTEISMDTPTPAAIQTTEVSTDTPTVTAIQTTEASTDTPTAAAIQITEVSADTPTVAELKDNAAERTVKPVLSSSSSSSSSSHLSDEGNAAGHKSEMPITTGDHVSNQKRPSLLGKLFGGHIKKKEDAHVETDVIATNKTITSEENDRPVTPTANPVNEEVNSPSSPTLGRRVTGFFSKKIPNYKKHNKDKVETSAAQENVVYSTNTETPRITNGEIQANYETEPTATNIVKGTVNETTNTAATVV